MLQMFIIRWQTTTTGKVWESERCATSAKIALASFRKAIVGKPVRVLGIADCDGRFSLQLSEG